MPATPLPVAVVFAAALVMCFAVVMPARGEAGTGPKAKPDVPEIVAHRGESYDAPENTMSAINLAWERGVQSVEFDVHLTADGKLIGIHDKDTLRVTGGPKRGGVQMLVKDETAETLRKLDVGTWKAPAFKGERMPLIDEILASLPQEPSRRFFIEVKVGPEAVEPLVTAIKSAGRPPEQTAVISFNYDTCREVKRTMPELKVYFLSDFKEDKKNNKPAPTIEGLIKKAKDANLDGLDLSYKGPLDAAAVKQIHNAGLECYVWTIDEVAVAKQFAEAGVDGITTNRALWLREQLEAAAAKAKQ